MTYFASLSRLSFFSSEEIFVWFLSIAKLERLDENQCERCIQSLSINLKADCKSVDV